MRKPEIDHNLTLLAQDARKAGVKIGSDELKIRFLYSRGLLFSLTLYQAHLISGRSERTLKRAIDKGYLLAFKVRGRWNINVYDFRNYLSGRGTGKGMPEMKTKKEPAESVAPY